MSAFDTFVFIVELISITSFAVSGALTALAKKMDLFGVVFVGITTSIGGGIIRDIVLGIHPPKSFNRPAYAADAALVAVIVFIVEYYYAKHREKPDPMRGVWIGRLMFWLDTVGIAFFSVVGVATAYELSDSYNVYLLSFVGMTTGVGGGVLRDLFTGNTPYIFVKHFYACACLLGSIVCAVLWPLAGNVISMLSGAAVIVILRFFAAKYRWNMPRIPDFGEKTADTAQAGKESHE